jgi:hypothetical protein
VSENVDARFLGRWHESQRRQEAMRKYLAQSELLPDSFEGKTLDLIAEALLTAPSEQHSRSPVVRTAAFMSDDR